MRAYRVNFIDSFNKSNVPKRQENPFFKKEEDYITHPFLSSQNADCFQPSFGKSPLKCLKRALKLKNLYAKKDLTYLLPYQTWGNKKIIKFVDNFGKTFEKLWETSNLNKKTLQKAINDFLPNHAKNKIMVEDFTTLRKTLLEEGYHYAIIENYLNSVQAVAANKKNHSIIYFDFDNVENKTSLPRIKNQIKHELKHACTNVLQNSYKNTRYNNSDKFGFFHHMFSSMENFYRKDFNEKANVDLTKENMLKFYGFKSSEDLENDFSLKITELAQDDYFSTEFNSCSNKTFKDLFGYLKLAAKDEKEAYLFDKEHRAETKNPACPTQLEFRSLFYAEMEDYFAEKERLYKKLL